MKNAREKKKYTLELSEEDIELLDNALYDEVFLVKYALSVCKSHKIINDLEEEKEKEILYKYTGLYSTIINQLCEDSYAISI